MRITCKFDDILFNVFFRFTRVREFVLLSYKEIDTDIKGKCIKCEVYHKHL